MDDNNQYQEEAYLFLDNLYQKNSRFINNLPGGQNSGEISVLGTLSHKTKPLTSGDLATTLNMKTSQVAAILKSLEKKKMIHRSHPKEDKRITLVSLTEMGQYISSQTAGKAVDFVALLYQKIGKEEMDQFLSTLLKISEYKECFKC